MTDLSEFTPNTPLMLVGCGNMGQALVRGWLTAGLNPAALVIVDPAANADDLPEFVGAVFLSGAAQMPAGVSARLLLLAVKPQVMNDVLAAMSPTVGVHTVVVSVAAGVTLAQMRRGLSGLSGGSAGGAGGGLLVRAMPNTPAAVGAGVTGLAADAGVGEADKALTDAVMKAAGKTVWLAGEELMDAVTATSGSGPAYVFHMVEALTVAAVKAGLPEAEAEVLARQTIVGAARLLDVNNDVSAGTLRERVTSPGGTTAAALEVLMNTEDGLTDLMTRAVAAAKKRGAELAD